MSILGNRIKKERENLKLSREDLAKKIGVSYSAIAMYEQGNREPNNEILLKMCEIFNCSMDYLMGKSEYKTKKEELNHYYKKIYNNALLDIAPTLLEMGLNSKEVSELISLPSVYDGNELLLNKIVELRNRLPEKYKEKYIKLFEDLLRKMRHQLEFNSLKTFKNNHPKCPVYGQISAGLPNWAEECLEEYIPIDLSSMGVANPDECFFLRVKGESMNKLVKNGAYALIRKQDVVRNGEVAVVLVNGDEATLKKFTRRKNIIVLDPMSDDPSFQTQIYDKKTQIKVIGKYIGKFELI